MNINTDYFGEITIDEKNIITFKDGVLGFEEYKKYITLNFGTEGDTLMCLQSIDEKDLSFAIIDPFSIKPNFSPKVPEEELKKLNILEDTSVSFYCICVVRDDFSKSTINLKAPLLINNETNLAKQVMLENSDYSIKHKII